MLEIEGVDIFSNSSTETTVSKDRAYRESSLSRMKCLTELRDKQRKEWTRDLKWLCEDVQVTYIICINPPSYTAS